MTNNRDPDDRSDPVLAPAEGSEQLRSTSVASERFRDMVYLAIIVAILSFAGGAGGTVLASRFEAAKWQRETTVGMKREIFAKRMELLERTIKAVNRLQILDIYRSSGTYSLVEAEDLIRAGKVAASLLPTVIESAAKVKEAQAELSAVMTLDVLYFGPMTKQAVDELQKAPQSAEPWWRVDQAKIQALLNATAEELQSGFR